MITIKARVVGENIELLESPLIASKSRYTVQLDLEFDEVWDGFGRTALFWGVDDEVYISQIANGKTTVPHEALDNHGRIKFGVYGTNGTKRIVTIKVTYKVVEGAYSSVASESIDPSPDLIDQIETSIGELESVINGVKNSTVRFDANQELTDAQKEIARGNIDATSVAALEAQATATTEALAGKVALDQGVAQAGKMLVVDENGSVTTGDAVQIDDTLQQVGQAADAAAVGTALNGKVAVQQGSGNAGKALVVGEDGNVTTGEIGIPEAVKDALIEIMRHVAYVEDDGQTYLVNLIVALGRGDFATWNIANRLTHAVNSNGITSVIRGQRYTATITGEAGYTLDSVTVTMGGTDVTSSVYTNGIITIPAVTGNVVITVTGSKHYTFLGNYVNDLYSTGGNQEIRLRDKNSRVAAVGTSGEIREISYDGSTSQYYYAFKIPSGAHTIQFDDGFGSEHQYLYGCMIARVNGDRIIKVDTSGSNIGNTFDQTDISDYNDGTLYAVINIFKWDGNWRADGRPNIDGNADLSNVDTSNWRVIIE